MRVILGVIVFIVGFNLGSVNAQEVSINNKKVLTGGFKAEGNLSGYFLNNLSYSNCKIRPGTSFGGFIRYEFSERFSVQEDFFSHYKNSVLMNSGIKDELVYGGVETSINFIFNRNIRKDIDFYIGGGSYLEYGLNADLKIGDKEVELYEKKQTPNSILLRRLLYGFSILVGIEFIDGLQLNAGYKMGLENVLENIKGNASMVPYNFFIGVGYRFK